MKIVNLLIAAVAWSWLAWIGTGLPDHGLGFWLASASVLVNATVAIALDPRRHGNAHVAIVVAQIAVLVGFAVARVTGHWPFSWDALPDRRYAALLATLGAAAAIGLVRGAVWARWMAIAFAMTSIAGGVLNTIALAAPRDDLGLQNALGTLAGLVILSQVMVVSVRERFHQAQPLWTSRDRLVRSARWAATSGFAAATMLVLYALCQPVAPDTVASALVLAPILGAGSVLVVARRTAGVLVLAVGGVALAVHAGVTVAHAEPRAIAIYYVAFWAPAAVLGIVAGVLAIARARPSTPTVIVGRR